MTYARQEYYQKWAAANREKLRSNTARWAQKNPAKRLLSSARARAKQKGVPFSITEDDVVIPEFCPVFGIKLQNGSGKGKKPGPTAASISLDRIDPALGYVPGNVQVISQMANSMKLNATREQLRMFAEWVLKGEAA